jgi:hypothetical protein
VKTKRPLRAILTFMQSPSDDAERPLRHPVHATRDEIGQLVDVAERGESAATPVVLIGGVGLVILALVTIMITLAFSVGYVAARGSDRPASASAPTPTTQSVSLPREPSPLLQTNKEALIENFWAIVAYAVLIGVFALPFAVLALLWRAAGRQRTA